MRPPCRSIIAFTIDSPRPLPPLPVRSPLVCAREVRARQFATSRIDGYELMRETGWVYARGNRIPRMIHELLAAFESVKGKLRMAPARRQPSAN